MMDTNKRSLLHHAVENRDVMAVEFFVNCGLQDHFLDANHQSALQLAQSLTDIKKKKKEKIIQVRQKQKYIYMYCYMIYHMRKRKYQHNLK